MTKDGMEELIGLAPGKSTCLRHINRKGILAIALRKNSTEKFYFNNFKFYSFYFNENYVSKKWCELNTR
jgi:hypothetical protein